jgi:carboxyl-terminal processing protease
MLKEAASAFNVALRGSLSVAIVASAMAGVAAARDAGPEQRFTEVREAFERLRADYVDVIDDANVLSAAMNGMRDGLLAIYADEFRQSTLTGAGWSLGDVEATFNKIVMEHPTAADPQKLADAAVVGMLKSLDPKSLYINGDAWRADLAANHSGGVGLELTMGDEGAVSIVGVTQNGPAAKAGVVAGDRLDAIDGSSVAGLSLRAVVAGLRGPLNSEVTLTISGPEHGDAAKITMNRARIYQQSVRTQRLDDVAYLLIAQFNQETAARLTTEISKIQTEVDATRFKGYIVDLRGSSGGLLDAAVSATGIFLERGLIATTRARNREIGRYEAKTGDVTKGSPLAVLIDRQTAAGAEIVAAALQYHHRAVIVGQRSAGVGSIQAIIPLGGGVGALRLTTGRLHTPSGQLIEGNGVVPDLIVERPQPDVARRPGAALDAVPGAAESPHDPQLQTALTLLRQDNGPR